MCRLLAVRNARPFAIEDELRPFAGIARASRAYQGHGWGCAWLQDDGWRVYRNVKPIWEDDLARFGDARVLVAHARSAYRDEGIAVENNMPFLCGPAAFVFNGELRGVRLREAGRIGAEKLFNFLLKAGAAAGWAALGRGIETVKTRTRYVRAMNFVLAVPGAFHAYSCFSEDPDYFTMHARPTATGVRISSEPFPGETGWVALPNDGLEVFSW